MKSSAEMKDLKIISINEGKQISKVKDIIINAGEGSLAFFVVDQPSDYFGARLIAFQDILGLGDYALIIPDSSVIQDVAHNALAVEFLQKDVKVIGSQVLTTKGCLIGQVTEMMMDEETGSIVACQVTNPQGKTNQVKCDQVITYGKEIILIDENGASPKMQSSDKLQSPESKKNLTVQGNPVTEEKGRDEKEILKRKIEAFGKNEPLLKSVDKVEKAEEKGAIAFSGDFNVFEQRQLQFLLGKMLNKDVPLDNGSLLKAGDQITADSLSVVKSRNTLMQLTAHVVK